MSEDNFIKNEKQFSEWFKINYSKLGYSKIIRGEISRCPDFIMLKNNKEVGVELETFASNFVLHNHDISKVDEIVCLIKDIELGKPIIVAKGARHKLPKTISIRVEEELWKQVKIHCIKTGKEISLYIETLAKNDLKKRGK
jgi:hypothetical protein